MAMKKVLTKEEIEKLKKKNKLKIKSIEKEDDILKTKI